MVVLVGMIKAVFFGLEIVMIMPDKSSVVSTLSAGDRLTFLK